MKTTNTQVPAKTKKLVLILGCATLLFISLFLVMPQPANALTNHTTIHIIGNSAFTSANGVISGTGTYADPYIIKGWDINAATNHGIWIEYTTAYFIVENCFVHGGAPNYHGIYLNYAYNGKIMNCEISWSLLGIAITNSGNQNHGNTVEKCYVHENWWSGIYLVYSNFNELDGNTLSENGEGFELHYSNNNMLTNNDANNNVNSGFYLYHANNNKLSGNTANNNRIGIELFSPTYGTDGPGGFCTLTSNTAKNNDIGIYLWGSVLNVLTSNTANDNNIGIELLSAQSNILIGNSANNNNYGFYLDGVDYNKLTSNTATQNKAHGILLTSAFSNTFTGNVANENTYDGFNIEDGKYNVFTSNSASFNGATGIYIQGTFSNNRLSDNSACQNGWGLTLPASSSNNHLAGNQAQDNTNYDWQPAGSGNTYNYNDYTTHNP